jgi:glyoxylase-like metal-dependent hydrolase (beta-lactamase superfamily II)
MQIITMNLGELETSCYLLISDEGNAAMIDPAGDCDKIIEALSVNSVVLTKILLTHGHFDHTGAVAQLKDITGAKVYIHANDECMLNDTIKNVAYLVPGYDYKPFQADVLLTGGDMIFLDELEISVMHTPGHTKGSVMYFVNDCIFTGDTIFEGSVGRTDFYSGDITAQRETLKRISALRTNYTLYPGHGDSTTLENEKKHNIYLGNVNMYDMF